ncbi:unnamed protein product [Lactuca virosa]|uniref:Serine-rich protein-like protein n=1 Tax=Lactuca virosa TaxID=75947 RepID=A0AAU9M1H9_9ASTR|nr:unnamed protein product [Lactuca virosa]
MATSSRKSNAPVLPLTSKFHRSGSPSGRFGSRSSAFAAEVSSPFASSTSSSFYSSPSSSHVYSRPTSPTRVNLHGFAPVTSSAVRFSLASRSGSPNRSMAMSSRDQVVRKQNAGNPLKNLPKKTCMCSPTTHPGSFRCSLHKNYNSTQAMTGGDRRLSLDQAVSPSCPRPTTYDFPQKSSGCTVTASDSVLRPVPCYVPLRAVPFRHRSPFAVLFAVISEVHLVVCAFRVRNDRINVV